MVSQNCLIDINLLNNLKISKMKNFKKLSLVAGFATLMSFGAEAQNTFPTSGNAIIGEQNKLIFGTTSSPLNISGTTLYGGVISLVSGSPSSLQVKSKEVAIVGGLIPIPDSPFDKDKKTKFHILDDFRLTFGPWGNDNQFIYGDDAFKTLIFGTDNKQRVYINNYGLHVANNLGEIINTTNTDIRLGVNGKIYATGVKIIMPVNNAWPWPDYVFKQDYKLRTLAEVEHFIAANNHLPDVPSELEVKTDGIELATMDAVLLRKVEELTLYMIQLQKDNLEMKAKLEALSK